MNRSFRFLLIAVWWVAAWAVPGCVAAAETIPLTILHMNDLHGHILPFLDKTIRDDREVGGAASFAGVIRQERAANPAGTLLLAAGDMFQGTPISNVFKGRPVIEVMNALQFDAMSLGNHEFDWGREALQGLRDAAEFPFLAANITGRHGAGLPGIRPWAMIRRGPVEIAVIGLITPETAYTTKPAHVADLTFLEPAAVLPGLIREVRGQGAWLVVVLSHLGLDADQELARQVPGIDLIVGGHSHTAVSEPVRVGGTVIVQAFCYGCYVGVLHLEVDPASRQIVRSDSRAVLHPVVAEGPADPAIAAMVARYEQEIRPEFSRVIGRTEVDLLRQPMAESNLGNLIADAMREAGGADIAFQNGGGIRADLPTGPVTLEGLYTLLPFDNQLVTLTLTGEQLLQLLEENGDLHAKILQMSGLAVEYDLSRPAGARVLRATVQGKPLEPAAGYRVAINDFLAAGGDRFTTFKNGAQPIYGDSLRDVVADYLQRRSPVRPLIEKRIVFRN